MKPLVSVIIPVYDVEIFLPRCLDSVLHQTYENLEVICVNDCSPDNCLCILKAYGKKDSRIRIVDRFENGGLSAARNSGMRVATGKYVYFLDSDDWIDEDYIEEMLEAAESSGAVVVLNNGIRMYRDGKFSDLPSPLQLNNIQNAYVDAHTAIMNVTWSTWAHLWNRNFLKNINASFPEGYIIEDVYFQVLTYLNTDKIYMIRKSNYNYFIRENSIMGQNSYNSVGHKLSLIKILNLIYDFLLKTDVDKVDFKLFTCDLLTCGDQADKKVIDQARIYFNRINKDVRRNVNLYKETEFEFFEDVLLHNNAAYSKNYYKMYMFEKLRNQMSGKK